MFLFIILVILEVLLVLLALMAVGFGIGSWLHDRRKTKAELAKHRYCMFELEQIADQVIDYQKFPSPEKCQAVNIKINMWNAACSGGRPLQTLDCPRPE
ncbi:MAG: hypothetical protein K0R82_1855 [Flavipsychrobacter sp.]|nr:hypothetical protein [Flavipsychrobacter sp.]